MMKKIICASLLCALMSSPTAFAENPITANEPVAVPYGQIQWLSRPHLNFSNNDLGHQNRKAVYRLYVSETGAIQQVDLVESSGSSTFDEKVKSSILRSKFKPYLENGVAQPFVALQPFEFITQPETKEKPLWKKLLLIP